MAEAAEELGFDSVWATEHIIVGPEAVNPYGRVYDPLVVLAGSPELWVGGGFERAIHRARELGDVWHPTRSVGPDAVRPQETLPEQRVVPRTRADQVDAFLEAGAEGAVVSIPEETSLRDFAQRYR